MLVIGGGQRDLVPALAGGNAAVVEMAAISGLREAEQRHRLRGPRAVADQLHKGVDGTVGRGQCLGNRFGGGPALAAVSGDAFGLVEGGGIETGFFRQARSRQSAALGKPVKRSPDLVVGQRFLRFWRRGNDPSPTRI